MRPEPNADSYTYRNGDGQCDSHSDPNGHCYSHSHCDLHTNGYSYCDCYHDCHSDCYSNCDCYCYCDSYGYGNIDAYGYSYRNDDTAAYSVPKGYSAGQASAHSGATSAVTGICDS